MIDLTTTDYLLIGGAVAMLILYFMTNRLYDNSVLNNKEAQKSLEDVKELHLKISEMMNKNSEQDIKVKDEFISKFIELAFDNRTSGGLINGLYIPRNLQYHFGAELIEHYKSGETIKVGIVSAQSCWEIYKQVGGADKMFKLITEDEFNVLFKLWTTSKVMIKRTNGECGEISISDECTIEDGSVKEWVNSLKDKIEP